MCNVTTWNNRLFVSFSGYDVVGIKKTTKSHEKTHLLINRIYENMTDQADLNIRKLKPDENIPYSLLLLADETKEAIDTYIHRSVIFAVEHEDEMIAVCATVMISEGVMEIKNIAVREDWQNKGIGYLFLLDIIEKAREQGCSELLIGTADCAHKQLYLYQKAGFQPYMVIPDFFIRKFSMPIFENGTQLKDMVILKKDL